MAQLWGGRFTKATDKQVFDFNASISFDKILFSQDIEGSIAHAVMLEKQGILTLEEKDAIVKGLAGIREDVENGGLIIDETQEDIHSFVEAVLTERIGEAGKKLHTGRSRNDQVALDMRLYTRAHVLQTDGLLKSFSPCFYLLWKRTPKPICPDLHICKRRSLLRLPIILAHILRCLRGTGSG